ncbi:MAG: flagellar motor switch protein FliG [Hyphomicrobiales bacterium]|jgi:flagellar motor switch protein FliG|nr:flagellar motor switch protein FliG [Hyphomicrobiales bacterium]
MAEAAVEVQAPDAREAFELLNGTQKCAILMLLLGEEEASEILKNLSPREVQQLGTAMYSVADVNQDTVNMVLDEFLAIIKAQTSIGLGADTYIRRVLIKALGEDKAGSVLTRITPSQTGKNIEILQWMDARSIAEMISGEHPQIIGIIVAHLEYAVAADVLVLLPEDIQAEVIQRIATLDSVQPEAIAQLERVMQLQFKANTSLRASKIGGVKAAAKIMNFTKTAMEQRIMGKLAKADKNVMTQILDNMFMFENLIAVDDKSMGTLLRSVEPNTLAIALKGADERLRDKIFGAMSSRAAASLKDEMDSKGPMRVSEVQEAQKQIIAVARQLSDAGTIMLAGRGDDYV